MGTTCDSAWGGGSLSATFRTLASKFRKREAPSSAVLAERVNAISEALTETLATAISPARSQLGEFEMGGPCLGEGGYARVVLGRNKKTGEAVAIKLLSATSVDGRAAVSEAAVVREVAALRRCGRHPNVCHLHAYFPMLAQPEAPSSHALVLEACRGGELFSLVEQHGALPEHRVRPLAVGIVAGLIHLHARGIAHRDLKLENILLGGENADVPKIVDLGLAHVHAPQGDGSWAPAPLTQFCGSRSYCAPEVMARLAYDGYRADLWSLGVCLFGLASGFFPVDEATPRDWRFERLARQQMGRPAHSSTHEVYGFYGRQCPLSPALVALLDSILHIQPARRAPLDLIAAQPWLTGAEQGAEAPSPAADMARAEDEPLEVDMTDPMVYRACDLLDSAQDTSPSAPAPAIWAAPPSLHRQQACEVHEMHESDGC